MNTSEYEKLLSLLIDDQGIQDIVSDVKKYGTSLSVATLLKILLKKSESNFFDQSKLKEMINAIGRKSSIAIDVIKNAKNYMIIDFTTDILSSFCSNLYAQIKLLEIDKSSAPVLERLNSTFNVHINQENIRSSIKLAGSSISFAVAMVTLPAATLFAIGSFVEMIKQLLLVGKMTYTIKPALDTFLQLLKGNPQKYGYAMYEKTKNWKTGIWYLIKTNYLKSIQNIDIEPRYQLEYLEDTSDISNEEKAKANQEGKSQLRECEWYEKIVSWTGVLNCQ